MFNKILSPMLLKKIDKPFQNIDYLYELKYDGIRILLYVSNNTFKMITRNGRDVSFLYPELKSIQKLVGNKKVIFDGEIVAFSNNKPSFNELSKRSHLTNLIKINNMRYEVPVSFIAFDIIYQNKDLTALSLIDRKEILDKFMDTEYFIKSKTYSNGLDLFKKVEKLGLEGVVAKRKDSVYIPNKRVDFWLKIKNYGSSFFLVSGYKKLKNKYALFLGEYKRNNLYFVGRVSVSQDYPIISELKALKKIPNQFVNLEEEGNFVKPIYKIKVYYLERTNNNTLRQPFVKDTKDYFKLNK